ncbi:MAG TPA: hypothetical protein PLI97_05875, partial [Fluviicola sp.]|nr:hypothetical protein [Fluviicola sp.]
MDPKLARSMEPRAATPARRLEALKLLSEAGIPTTAMVAPVIPALNDSEIERIIDAAAFAGVREASYVLLRLPLEVRDLFREWLMANYPDRYRHVFTLIRDMREGRTPTETLLHSEIFVSDDCNCESSKMKNPTQMKLTKKNPSACIHSLNLELESYF